LNKTQTGKIVKNFSEDIKDSECYIYLLHQIAPEIFDLSALEENNLEKRASRLLCNIERLNLECDQFVNPKAIEEGNSNLNLAFVANLFDKCSEIEKLNQKEFGRRVEMTKEKKVEEEPEKTEENKLKESTQKGKVGRVILNEEESRLLIEEDNKARETYAKERLEEWEEYQNKSEQWKQQQQQQQKQQQDPTQLKPRNEFDQDLEETKSTRTEFPIVLWYNESPEKYTKEQQYLALNSLQTVFCETLEAVIEHLEGVDGERVKFIVTDWLHAEKTSRENQHDKKSIDSNDADDSSNNKGIGTMKIAAGLNLANILREDYGVKLPIICYSDRVKKDPKQQQLAIKNGVIPVMRGQSFFKLLGIPEPPLSLT